MLRCCLLESMKMCVCCVAQGRDIRLFSSPEEDSSLYFTYSGGQSKLEVVNLNYEVKWPPPLTFS